MVLKYQRKANEEAKKIADLEATIKIIESKVPESYNWAERQPTNRTEDEIEADRAKIEKKMKAAQVWPGTGQR